MRALRPMSPLSPSNATVLLVVGLSGGERPSGSSGVLSGVLVGVSVDGRLLAFRTGGAFGVPPAMLWGVSVSSSSSASSSCRTKGRSAYVTLSEHLSRKLQPLLCSLARHRLAALQPG